MSYSTAAFAAEKLVHESGLALQDELKIQERRRCDLIKDGLRRRRAAHSAAPQHDVAEAPAHTPEESEQISSKELPGGSTAEPKKRDDDSKKCDSDARPLQSAKVFFREKLQSECRKNRRRVEKDD
jgi:hypothetical protein